MKRGIGFLLVGLLFVLISAPPLYSMNQELLLQRAVNKQYKIENIYHPMDMGAAPFHTLQYLQDGTMKPFPEMKREVIVNGNQVSDYGEFTGAIQVTEENQLTRVISFYNTDISIVDTFTGTEEPDLRQSSQVEVKIEGVNVAEPVRLEIRPTHLDNNRYHGYLGMLKMTHLATEEEYLMIVQRLFEDLVSTPEEDFKWKIISINQDGAVETDTFTRRELDDPAYRRDLIHKATVSPYALGYKSNVLQSYPSLIFPLAYPFGTLAIGVIFLLLGVLFVIKRRRKVSRS